MDGLLLHNLLRGVIGQRISAERRIMARKGIVMDKTVRAFWGSFWGAKLYLTALLFALFGCETGAEVNNESPVNYESPENIDSRDAAGNQADPSAEENVVHIDGSEETLSKELAQTSNSGFSFNGNPHDSAVVATEHGAVEGGVSDDESYLYWLGVPYAAPPVDDGNQKLRWRASREPKDWQGLLPTQQFQDHCVQLNYLYSLDMDVSGSEDCLYLNIWRPNTDEEDLPVYFWIHGGGFQFEAASMAVYNGARFATSQNVVVVTLDYRLGYLGWLYHEALQKDDWTDEDRSGNFALLDVIKALGWVQKNIENFGGARDKVTVAGQSAGAAFVQALLVSPKVEADYFRGAIIQSGSVMAGNTAAFNTMAKGRTAANTLMKTLLVRNGDAQNQQEAQTLLTQMSDEQKETLLRGTDAETLAEVAWEASGGSPAFPNTMFMDKTVLRGTAKKDFANDKYLHVPIMEGTTASEGRAFGLFMLINRPKAMTYLREEFDPNARDNLTATQLLTLQEQMMFALVDPIMTFANQFSETSLLDTIAGSNEEDIFVYRFQYDNAPQPMDTLFASGHMSELPFVFGNIQADSAAENCYAYFMDADRTLSERTRLSNRMMNYWGSFVRTGNPNDSASHRQPRWNSYSRWGTLKRLHLGTEMYMMP